MSDDIYRPRKKITPEELGQLPDRADTQQDPLRGIQNVQDAIAAEHGVDANEIVSNAPFAMSGNIPPQLTEAINQKRSAALQQPVPQAHVRPQTPKQPKVQSRNQNPSDPTLRSERFENALERLNQSHHWEEFELPSMAKFYQDIPPVIHIRPMTGEEEQILATPRFVKRGKAIDMIFQRCIQENIATEDLLTIDRNHLLIYLRGISYTNHYDVELKCPLCGAKFSTIVDLNALEVNDCPDDFSTSSLEGVMPVSGFKYRYRLSTGRDELDVSQYREKRIEKWGDQSEDDTLVYRTALLVEEIEGVTNKKEIQHLLKKLPVSDVQHLRNETNEPPFGVDTKLIIDCPSCLEDFPTELPLEANFFFPRKKKAEVPA